MYKLSLNLLGSCINTYGTFNRLKTTEIEEHIEKLKKRQQQQQELQEQINSRCSNNVPTSVADNPFARSENLMILYQREKAKQLYQEQLEIIKRKREYEVRVADMERKHSLERLAASRRE